jgi:mannose-1-phosphate guanylyltransferase
MAGGRGERFWPQSRNTRPKHLLPIVGNAPLLSQTIARMAPLVEADSVLVITSADQAAGVREVCPGLPPQNIIVEPTGRDTANAVALANLVARRIDPNATLALLPADHVVADREGFQRTLGAAFAAAETSPLIITIGVRPTHPETGFGYIQRGDALPLEVGAPVFGVRRFVEKPDLATAQAYLDSGDYLWNGGMFVWTVQTLGAALEEHAPDISRRFAEMERLIDSGVPFETVLGEHYPRLPKISIDFAVMEKARNVATIPAGFDWDDVGAWPAIARHFPKDASGNTLLGSVETEEVSDSIVVSTSDKITAVLGVQGLIVVNTPDATLVLPADRAQDIKRLLKKIAARPGGDRWL